ncbi:cbb3-type cytochrome c oxidase subunit I [Maribacter sp. 2210JD10-5]|uniref:cbb3-type cytochrome c oxidase subunit I n=1 Tax=Maribacter sp. 2210JD10-5 TaxID=3386272 RepID=UPI0039BCF4C9
MKSLSPVSLKSMSKFSKSPYLIFFIAAAVTMLVGILSRDATLDINIHDTYFIIGYLHLAVLISIFFGLIGLGYWIMHKMNKRLSMWLNWTHILLTIGGLIVLFMTPYFSFTFKDQSAFPLFDELERKNLIMISTISLMIIAQFIYLINLIIGMFRTR